MTLKKPKLYNNGCIIRAHLEDGYVLKFAMIDLKFKDYHLISEEDASYTLLIPEWYFIEGFQDISLT